MMLHGRHPLTGTGLSGFKHDIQPYRAFAGYTENLIYPHNIFLNFWTETGLLGLAAVTWSMVVWVRLAAGGLRRGGPRLVYHLGIAAAGIVILVHGMLDVPFFKNDLAWLTMALIGIQVAALRQDLGGSAATADAGMSLGLRTVRNSALVVGARLVSKLLVFVVVILVIRSTGVGDYGRFTALVVYATLVGMVVDLGLRPLFTREVAKDRSRLTPYLNSILSLKLVLLAPALGLLALALWPRPARPIALYLAGLRPAGRDQLRQPAARHLLRRRAAPLRGDRDHRGVGRPPGGGGARRPAAAAVVGLPVGLRGELRVHRRLRCDGERQAARPPFRVRPERRQAVSLGPETCHSASPSSSAPSTSRSTSPSSSSSPPSPRLASTAPPTSTSRPWSSCPRR